MMRASTCLNLALCLALVTTLGACRKKEEEQQQSTINAAPATSGGQQVAPTQAEQAPQYAPQPKQEAPVMSAVPPAPPSIAQPLRPNTLIIKQNFSCKNGTKFAARFMHNPNQVEITFEGRMPVTMPQDYIGTGYSYSTSAYQLVGQGNQAQWIMTGKTPVNCTIVK